MENVQAHAKPWHRQYVSDNYWAHAKPLAAGAANSINPSLGISDSYWAHAKLLAAASAAANMRAHPIVLETPSRKVIGPSKPSAEAAEISIGPF